MWEIIIYCVVGLVMLAVVSKVFSALFKRFPVLIYVLVILVALFFGIAVAWWVGIIAGLIAYSMLLGVQGEGGHKGRQKCLNCNSWNTTELKVTQDLIDNTIWKDEIPEIREVDDCVKCNECNHTSWYLKSYSEVAALKNKY